ncbi:DeoR family transcriptional regulator [Scopulibacillus cellulosilyticus]|uniref:DeoR family transcriptional regulator n=1 Tax=Scopulibacillus cellulosilyticus TaxID=2665665 RepID=A0ABW2PTY8_9BACL
MLPIERQKLIKKWIEEQKDMKISELSRRLNVSEMTIHRDVQALIDEGTVVKTFGGITLSPEWKEEERAVHDRCVYCYRKIHERLSVRLIKKDGGMEVACCAHCGLLRLNQLNDSVTQGICYDFLLNTTISVFSASYVVEPELQVGCCHPQILTFGASSHAKRFVKGFGGRYMNYDDVIKEVANYMCSSREGCKTN